MAVSIGVTAGLAAGTAVFLGSNGLLSLTEKARSTPCDENAKAYDTRIVAAQLGGTAVVGAGLVATGLKYPGMPTALRGLFIGAGAGALAGGVLYAPNGLTAARGCF